VVEHSARHPKIEGSKPTIRKGLMLQPLLIPVVKSFMAQAVITTIYFSANGGKLTAVFVPSRPLMPSLMFVSAFI
jgi:hypothetical protein